jgi:hypothetical protein
MGLPGKNGTTGMWKIITIPPPGAGWFFVLQTRPGELLWVSARLDELKNNRLTENAPLC